jgi:N-carbamoyl-L-amino-acid hydrolase
VLDRLQSALEDMVAEANRGPCKVTLADHSRSVPQQMDPTFQAALDTAAETHTPGKHQRMPSGAGHDAQVLAERVPAGMLFVPSIGGISHHYAEDTSDEDIVLGCQVLADAAAALLR